jgi:hypothetical protein
MKCQRAICEDGDWLVPKKDLVSALQPLLQSRRLAVAHTLQEAPTLAQELTNFKAKTPARTENVVADWRERVQDELVLAVAVAAWQGELDQPIDSVSPFVLGRAPDRALGTSAYGRVSR